MQKILTESDSTESVDDKDVQQVLNNIIEVQKYIKKPYCDFYKSQEKNDSLTPRAGGVLETNKLEKLSQTLAEDLTKREAGLPTALCVQYQIFNCLLKYRCINIYQLAHHTVWL